MSCTIWHAKRRILYLGGSVIKLPRERVRPRGKRPYWVQWYCVITPQTGSRLITADSLRRLCRCENDQQLIAQINMAPAYKNHETTPSPPTQQLAPLD